MSHIEVESQDNEDKSIFFRSYRQGGTRYSDTICTDGKEFQFNFVDNLYMIAQPLWDQLTPVANEEIKFKPLSIEQVYSNTNPLFVEIGIGNGEFISHHASQNPQQNWLGFEVYHIIFEKAVSRAKRALDGRDSNIRLLQFDAELFVRMLPDNSVSGFFVNFPDPWPKAKHTKRRLLKPWFMDLMRQKLIPGGSITVATDHDDYGREIDENFAQVEGLESTLGATYLNDIGDYYKTKYYRKFAAKGTVYFFNMKRIK